METVRVSSKRTGPRGKKVDLKKVARAYGILRHKRLSPLTKQRNMRDQ